MANKLTFEDVRNGKGNSLLIYEYVRGSVAYGLNIPKQDEHGHDVSDIDTGGVYICPPDSLLGLGFDYQEQIESEKHDDVWYELKKYFSLLIKSNPVAIESLFIPESCIRYEHPIMTEIKKHRDKFLSMDCVRSMIGFSVSQCKKARSNKKLIVNPVTERLWPLDFCFLVHKQGSGRLKNWLEYRNLSQKYIALVKIPNMQGYYGAYYDWGNFFRHENITIDNLLSTYDDANVYDTIFIVNKIKELSATEEMSEVLNEYKEKLHSAQMKNMVSFIIEKYNLDKGTDNSDIIKERLVEWYNSQEPIGYCGIVREDGQSNEIRFNETPKEDEVDPFIAAKEEAEEFVMHTQKTKDSVILSSVPKDAKPICHIFYNQDGYQLHCRCYREYEHWKKNRNEVRFNENIENGCEFDRKNFMHAYRILRMGLELSKTGKFNVDRRNIDREFLLDIRLGHHKYDFLMNEIKNMTGEIENAMHSSILPEHVDVDYVNDLILDIRHKQLKGEL